MVPLPSYTTQYYESCKVLPPCKNCDCANLSIQCQKEKQYPEIYYEPNTPIAKCCATKPKKSFWQQLFGEKKCSFCLKKKQNCDCQRKKKQKCEPVSNFLNLIRRNSAVCTPCPPKSDKPCKSTCRCRSKSYCPLKRNFPSPNAICGCHFYFNIENLKPKRQCCPVSEVRTNLQNHDCNSVNIHEEPVHDNLLISSPYPTGQQKRKSLISDNMTEDNLSKTSPFCKSVAESRGFSYTASDKNRDSCSPCEKRRKSSEGRRRSGSSSTVKNESREGNLHVGVTFTKEETKYYRRTPIDSPYSILNQNSKDDGKLVSKGLNETPYEKLQLEIDGDITDVKLNKNNNEDEERSNVSVIDEFLLNQDNPKSESFNRELLPLMKKKRLNPKDEEYLSAINKDTKTNSNGEICWKRQEQQLRSSAVRNMYTQNEGRKSINIDKKMSEIFKKLQTLEDKINVIEKIGKENKDIRIDFDEQKSTVSFNIKDLGQTTSNETNSVDNNNKDFTKADAVIQIRRTTSTSSSSLVDNSSSPPLKLSHNSQSLGRGKKKNHINPKIIIKFPRSKNIDRSNTFSNKNAFKSTQHDKNGQPLTWFEVSNDLKLSSNTINRKCYCFECMCKRNSNLQ